MASTKDKGGFKVRTVANKEDRKRPSVFIRLRTDETFKAYAMFEPDMELSDNPGFFEYFSHWDDQAKRYVPCLGDRCPFCLANQSPGTQAMTLWYFPDNDAGKRLKVFTMNNATTKDVADISEEDGGMLGKKFRVKRMTDGGEYRVRTQTDKPLTKKEIKTLLKDAPNLREIIEKQAKAEYERLKALSALADDEDDSDDEDDEDEETPKNSKGGKAKKESKAKDEDDDEDDDDSEDEDDDDDSDDDDDDDDDSDDDDGDDDDSDDEDSDDDDSDDDEDEDSDSDDDEDDDDSDELSGVEFTIAKTNEEDETLTGKTADGEKLTVWVAEGVDVDYDKVKKGTVVVIDAKKDDEGDFVATKVKVTKKKAK